MANRRVLEVGEKIEVELKDGERGLQYLSKVEEVLNNKTYIISRPIQGRNLINLRLGEIIKVTFVREEAVYYFEARVTKTMREGENMSVKITSVSDMYKLQRRNYYRLSVMVPLMMVIEDGKKRVVKALDTIDISGGGLRINMEERLEEGREVWLFINIPEINMDVIKASVIRSLPSLKNRKLYETALEFKEIEPRVRAAIIQYIFDKQREIIKRGVR